MGIVFEKHLKVDEFIKFQVFFIVTFVVIMSVWAMNPPASLGILSTWKEKK